jgi:hypothetical protein
MRRRGSLSLKQIFSILAAFVVVYLVSANHKALTAWFAVPAKPARPAAAPKAEGQKEVRGTQ